ncbi:MAG: DUF5655 domain-containing protein [Candidatus Syntrophosphaera sp.]
MPLYHIHPDTKVIQLKPTTFKHEKNLQRLFEDNLETLMGVRFIASEFTTGDRQRGRIDTLGLDEDNSPTIIEYKKTSKDNVINQGLFYLDWLVDHRGDFTLAARKALGGDVEVDWSNPRLILIAESFSRYDEYAVNRIGANVELWEYRRYADDYLYLEPIFVTTQKSTTPDTKTETEVYDLEYHLGGKPDDVVVLFESLQERIFQLNEDGDITEKYNKNYIGYKHGKNFCEIKVQQKGLKMHLDILYEDLSDPYELARDVQEIGHHGTGDVEVKISDIDDLDKVMYLIEQAYQQTL